jgi:hypothetical protein
MNIELVNNINQFAHYNKVLPIVVGLGQNQFPAITLESSRESDWGEWLGDC